MLQNQFNRLLWFHGWFLVVVTFSNLFVNLYLWALFRDFSCLGQFNLVVALCTILGFLSGMYVIRFWNTRYSFGLAGLFMLSLFVLLAEKGEQIKPWGLLLGSLLGLGLGMYYSAFNLNSFFITAKEERDLFFGREQIVNRLVSLVTPIFFSSIIHWLGYEVAFQIVCVILTIIVIPAFFLPKIKTDFTIKNLNYRDVWKEYKLVLLSISGFGFLQSWVQIGTSVYLLLYIANETQVGLWNAILAALGMGMGYVLSKIGNRKNRKKLVSIGAILLTAAITITLFPNAWTVITFNIIAVVALAMIWIPINVVHYNRISDLSCPMIEQCKIGLSAHYLLVREFMLNLGRILFFMFMMLGFIYQGYNVPVYMIFILTFLPIAIFSGNTMFFIDEANES